jgi:folylpolyglutamate synthase/dihydropteroate synthase
MSSECSNLTWLPGSLNCENSSQQSTVSKRDGIVITAGKKVEQATRMIDRSKISTGLAGVRAPGRLCALPRAAVFLAVLCDAQHTNATIPSSLSIIHHHVGGQHTVLSESPFVIIIVHADPIRRLCDTILFVPRNSNESIVFRC